MTLLQKKALHNLLQFQINELDEEKISAINIPAWQLENYRILPLDTLFNKLQDLKVDLRKESFEECAKNCDTPEELNQIILQGDAETVERGYLLVFELWRRLCPEKRAPSIFCDELDHQIFLWTEDNAPLIQDTLAYLQEILDENVDMGIAPQTAFQWIQSFCAHDLEAFLYDYIFFQIENGELNYALDLLEGFSPYVRDNYWFTYLSAIVEVQNESEEGYQILEKLVQEREESALLFEIMTFIAQTGNHSLFIQVATKLLTQISDIEEFKEFSELCLKHYEHIQLNALVDEIKTIGAQDDLASGAQNLKKILEQKVHFAIEP